MYECNVVFFKAHTEAHMVERAQNIQHRPPTTIDHRL